MTRILILLFFPLSIVCQNLDKIFFKKNEVYFSFNYEKKSQLDRLSKIISLDHKIEKTTAYAYANKKQFENFLKENIEFKLINNQVSNGIPIRMALLYLLQKYNKKPKVI